MIPTRLYHYSCDHGVEGILATGELRPNPHAGWQPRLAARGFHVVVLPVVWLTDIDVTGPADADLIGLGSNTVTTCDRVAYRFRVPATAAVQWWPTWADRAVADGRLEAGYRQLLELGRAPERWWVSEANLRGPQLDERYLKRVLA